MRVDERRIRKEKYTDSKVSGYVWTGPNLGQIYVIILTYRNYSQAILELIKTVRKFRVAGSKRGKMRASESQLIGSEISSDWMQSGARFLSQSISVI